MYDQIKSVFTGEGLSDFFECTIGNRQGCMLIPFLFIFFLNEFISYCKSENCQGICIDENCPNLMLLLFPDDMVNCADPVGYPQNVINKLYVYSKKWGLQVNIEKTKESYGF